MLNHKQWILLITMSTVLLLSIGTITMMLLSDEEINETEPAKPDKEMSETESVEEEVRENQQTINSGTEPDHHSEDSPDMVNEWFDDFNDMETETNHPDLKQSDHSDDLSEDALDNTIVFPTAPEEPEINFEDHN